jgi:hypothetical protein
LKIQPSWQRQQPRDYSKSLDGNLSMHNGLRWY